MKTYELQYKRRTRNNNMNRYGNVHQRRSILVDSELSDHEEFLQSAQTFYKKHPVKQNSKSRVLNSSIVKKNEDLSKSKATQTHQNIRQSIEKDRSSNLQHWRRQAFNYQEKVFMLEKELGKLKSENCELKTEIKCLQNRNQMISKSKSKEKPVHTEETQKHDLMEIIKNQNEKIHQMSVQLTEKSKIIEQLELQLTSFQSREEKQPFLGAVDFSFAQETARWSIKQERSTVTSKEPLDQEQLNNILQKLGKNIEELDFKKNSQHQDRPTGHSNK